MVSMAQTAHHWMLLLSSVPFASDIFILHMEWPTWFTPSLRGGMRSLMRSKPLASSKLVILCWGENPRIAEEEETCRVKVMLFHNFRIFQVLLQVVYCAAKKFTYTDHGHDYFPWWLHHTTCNFNEVLKLGTKSTSWNFLCTFVNAQKLKYINVPLLNRFSGTNYPVDLLGKLKSLEAFFCLSYSTHFVHSTVTTGSKTDQ
ncbi:hypothetical protein GOODEAATRI_010395 [Goodea atripinnis]|uniref:Uncharacterized protein n=1 Tax=Goodea atripinnis TaxID=208336 RepID=A0ABV0P4X1_9TELE